MRGMRQCQEVCEYTNYKINGMPLTQRSWVLQERLLSPRVLHFGACEMIWECDSGVMCECTPREINRAGVNGIKILYGHKFDAKAPHHSSLLRRNLLSKVYFSCQITFAKDRLPALSGLSRVFQEGEPEVGSYLAGLWLKHLPETLLWWCSHQRGFNGFSKPVDDTDLARHNGAPTWSWASVG
jgi:hypothetical protein